MLKKLISLCAAVLVFAGCAGGLGTPSKATFVPAFKEVVWQGTTDAEMLDKVRADLASAQRWGQHIRAQLISPGGPVVACLEISRLVRNASDAGMIVEIHGSGVVASCGTFILAAGTPGHRYISFSTLFLIHGPQRGGFGGSSCISWVDDPKTEDDKITNELLLLMAQAYTRYTGRTGTLAWFECDASAVGVNVALERGFADRVER